VNPLYLGSKQRRIFSIYDAAVGGGPPRAAVLCYPWGAEYVYAHRSLRQLAAKLAASGFHTLRFDFYGTGDSGGEFSQADLAGWQLDTEAAIAALSEMVGVQRVVLIGLRLGANIAAQVAVAHPARCEALVLWDPIASGGDYVRSLHTRSGARVDAQSGCVEVDGFELTPEMAAEISQIELKDTMASSSCRSLVLVTDTEAAAAAVPLPGTEAMPAPLPWLESVMITGEVPVKVIKRIIEWLN